MIIEKLEGKAAREYYKKELEKEIDQFLPEHELDFMQFSDLASDILPKNAMLRRFLYKK